MSDSKPWPVYEAGQLYALSKRNRDMLSARSDILLANLRSIGCSIEKLLEIMENVLALFLGPVSAAVKYDIIPTSRTIIPTTACGNNIIFNRSRNGS